MGFKLQAGLLDVGQHRAGGVVVLYDLPLHEVGKSMIPAQFYFRPLGPQMLLVLPFRHLRAVLLLEYVSLFLLEAHAPLDLVVYGLNTHAQHFGDLRRFPAGFQRPLDF